MYFGWGQTSQARRVSRATFTLSLQPPSAGGDKHRSPNPSASRFILSLFCLLLRTAFVSYVFQMARLAM